MKFYISMFAPKMTAYFFASYNDLIVYPPQVQWECIVDIGMAVPVLPKYGEVTYYVKYS